jgi:hypothetical protein
MPSKGPVSRPVSDTARVPFAEADANHVVTDPGARWRSTAVRLTDWPTSEY